VRELIAERAWLTVFPLPAYSPSAGYEAVEGVGPVLKSFEPVADEGFEPVEGDDGEAGQARAGVPAPPRRRPARKSSGPRSTAYVVRRAER
jgi:hypothetical protein